MNLTQQMMLALKEFINVHEVSITECPHFHKGKKMVDQTGDYLIVYFHSDHGKFVYTFKGMEDTYFFLIDPDPNNRGSI
ncbi:hypothetical protein [Halobacillus naozhouensis]|uniref:Uncharacterized protein n=1 Tax=Halobacillus naozhouensis TaxID=554880 RepID=A0ABY8IZM4_9BACI|nr:hypothetical protein [Halobacillus naozhouensis]WFT75692.1 hypothetical protein P9989_04700 [Halobacillus naozhouensis]